MIHKINDYYKNNKKQLLSEYNFLENKINGRICHSSIILLKILTNIFEIDNFLEIGVHNGGSTCLIINDNKNLKNVVGIDMFEDIYDEEKHFSSEKFKKYQYFIKDNLSMKKTIDNIEVCRTNEELNIKLIKGNSYYDSTENKLKELDIKFDLIHIDGDHTFDGVKNDFERYFKYLNTNKFLVFDDYHHQDIKNYINTLKSRTDIEFIGSFKFHDIAEQFLIMKIK